MSLAHGAVLHVIAALACNAEGFLRHAEKQDDQEAGECCSIIPSSHQFSSRCLECHANPYLVETWITKICSWCVFVPGKPFQLQDSRNILAFYVEISELLGQERYALGAVHICNFSFSMVPVFSYGVTEAGADSSRPKIMWVFMLHPLMKWLLVIYTNWYFPSLKCSCSHDLL